MKKKGWSGKAQVRNESIEWRKMGGSAEIKSNAGHELALYSTAGAPHRTTLSIRFVAHPQCL